MMCRYACILRQGGGLVHIALQSIAGIKKRPPKGPPYSFYINGGLNPDINDAATGLTLTGVAGFAIGLLAVFVALAGVACF
jgi:hypothetical protein